ncbi:MAG: hypothetical protein DI551_09905 [Micavibrio aeruginosavorus]|uniref:Uncharacterized protein n=1 Tax=Micavibrio aeruginosavorus TaxID=349221 RepID=A0A2W5MTH3_9BACT|nr:MAG: hypothetical protein DI551_09905 [Micavibrio aeruginosavorus]
MRFFLHLSFLITLSAAFPADAQAFEIKNSNTQENIAPDFDMFPDGLKQKAIAPVAMSDAIEKQGSISRFQRHVISLNDGNNPHSSPASQYFDDVMDHLEMLMAPEIEKNNKIAVLQEKIPGYKF